MNDCYFDKIFISENKHCHLAYLQYCQIFFMIYKQDLSQMWYIHSYAECPLPLELQKWDSAVLCSSPRLTFTLRDIWAVSLQTHSIACSLQLCIQRLPCIKQWTFKRSTKGRYRKRLQQCPHPPAPLCIYVFI